MDLKFLTSEEFDFVSVFSKGKTDLSYRFLIKNKKTNNESFL